MDKAQAHAILYKCHAGFPIPLALTNTALERTGDISGLFGEPLRFNGHEQRNNRPCQAHDQVAEIGFSYSQCLDCSTTESAK